MVGVAAGATNCAHVADDSVVVKFFPCLILTQQVPHLCVYATEFVQAHTSISGHCVPSPVLHATAIGCHTQCVLHTRPYTHSLLATATMHTLPQ